MAIFIGTIKEFNKYIGGYSRNTVQNITRKHKKEIGKCEHCGSRTKKLQAAHRKGKERPEIVCSILQNYIEDKIINIELETFEQQYLLCHQPIDEAIIVLCKKCHQEYDKNSSISVSNISEDKQIEILMDNIKLKKKEAISLLLEKGSKMLSNDNTAFSNINKSKEVYWVEPTNDKFKNLFYIILNDSLKKKLHLFQIDKDQIINPWEIFEQRSDKNSSKLIIEYSETNFKDKSGYDFKQHLIKSIIYT